MLKYSPVIFILWRLTENIKKNMSGFSNIEDEKNAHQMGHVPFLLLPFGFFLLFPRRSSGALRSADTRGQTEGVSKCSACWLQNLHAGHIQILTRLCSCSSSSSSCCVSSEESRSRSRSLPQACWWATGHFSLGSAQTVSTHATVLHSSNPRVFLLLLSLPLQAFLLPLLLLLLLAVRLERRSVHVVAGDAKRCAETIILLLVGCSQSVSLCYPAKWCQIPNNQYCPFSFIPIPNAIDMCGAINSLWLICTGMSSIMLSISTRQFC